MIQVIDNFLSNPQEIRRLGIEADYMDWEGFDGSVYRRVALTTVPGLQKQIEEVVGPVNMLGMGYRLNYSGELPNALIHTDLGWGTHALVLFLSEGGSGTAFWRHVDTHTYGVSAGDIALYDLVKSDWNRRDAWDLLSSIPMQFNRALIYPSTLFHSRYPFEAFGNTPDTGRLIAVAFFTPQWAVKK